MQTTNVDRQSRSRWAPVLLALLIALVPLLSASPTEAQRGCGGSGLHGFGHGQVAGHGYRGFHGNPFFGRGIFPGSQFGGRFNAGHTGQFHGGHALGTFDHGFRFGALSLDRSFFFVGPSRFGRHPGVRSPHGTYGFGPYLFGVYPWTGDRPAHRAPTDVYSRAAMKPGPFIEFGGHRVRNLTYERSVAGEAPDPER